MVSRDTGGGKPYSLQPYSESTGVEWKVGPLYGRKEVMHVGGIYTLITL